MKNNLPSKIGKFMGSLLMTVTMACVTALLIALTIKAILQILF